MLADSTPERKFIANLAKNDLWPCANRGTIFPGLMANDEDHSCRAELHNLLSTNVSTTNGRPFPYPIAKNFVVNAWLVQSSFFVFIVKFVRGVDKQHFRSRPICKNINNFLPIINIFSFYTEGKICFFKRASFNKIYPNTITVNCTMLQQCATYIHTQVDDP